MTDRQPQRVRPATRRRLHIPSAFLLGLVAGTVLGVVGTLTWQVLPDGSAPERGKLLILSGRDTSDNQQRRKLIERWNQEHPDNQAELVETAVIADQQRSDMVAIAQAQAAPGRAEDPDHDIDIYNLDVTFTAEFAAAGYLRPIDQSRLAEGHLTQFVPEVLDSCRYQGDLWALPFNTDAGLLYYRTDLLGGAADAPGQRRFDWNTVIERSRALADPAGRGGRPTIGYAGQFGPYEGLTVNGMELIWSGGVDSLVDENTNRVIFQRERWERPLRQVAAARKEGLLARNAFGVPGDEGSSLADFGQRRALFMRNWPVNYPKLATPDGVPTPQAPFQVTRLPGPSALGGQNLAVAKQSRQPRAAQALIEFLTSRESQTQLFEPGGFAPTRNDVYADEDLRGKFPYLGLLAEVVREARVRPRVPHYFQFSQVFREGVRTALEGDGTLPKDFETRLNQALHGG
ncbi:extracellular solute-binding protein [Micromonospora sp. NPDC051925]|uniref:extracellular solute-binding protein n=1 Tax=Micromonospora sp. NPDC051925 TaxID=3364288 RepID=UPI0037C7A169